MSDTIINQDMGDLIEEFQMSKKAKIVPIVIGVISLIIGLIVILGFIASHKLYVFRIALFYIIGILPILLGIISILYAVNMKPVKVSAFVKGLYYSKGTVEQILNWDDIKEFYYRVTRHYRYGIHTGTTHIFTIIDINNKKTVFDDRINNVAKLGEILRDKTTNTLLPKFAKEYEEGKTIKFGNISINKEGIANGREVISWKEVKGFQLQKGIVTINKEGKWLSWSSLEAGFIPNLFVLLTFVDSIIGINR